MKRATVVIGSLLLMLALSACGKKGGGGASAQAYCTGNGCIGGIGDGGLIGQGSWKGGMRVVDLDRYRQFLCENGFLFCAGPVNNYSYKNIYVASLVGVRLDVNPADNQGYLPGPIRFAVQAYQNGRPIGRLRQIGDGYTTSGNNGIKVVYNPNFHRNRMFYGGHRWRPFFPLYQQNPYLYSNPSTTAPVLIIGGNFVNKDMQVMNASMIYKGYKIAEGRLFGYANQGTVHSVSFQQPLAPFEDDSYGADLYDYGYYGREPFSTGKPKAFRK